MRILCKSLIFLSVHVHVHTKDAFDNGQHKSFLLKYLYGHTYMAATCALTTNGFACCTITITNTNVEITIFTLVKLVHISQHTTLTAVTVNYGKCEDCGK